MDSSLQSPNLAVDELDPSLVIEHEHTEGEAGEPHIHLPNPSLWPLLLSAAILVTVTGLLFIPDNPWLVIVGAPFILLGIIGWAMEDPMAPPKAHFIPSSEQAPSRFKIGQLVLDKSGEWIGTVQARFSQYILVDRGGLAVKVYYVPQHVIEDEIKDNVLRLTVSEAEMFQQGWDRVPNDLYQESVDPGIPQNKGVPMFGRSPLSPAETGHYNYGPNFPGINTDAAGSYYPEEVRPVPQKYISDRRKFAPSNRPTTARAFVPIK